MTAWTDANVTSALGLGGMPGGEAVVYSAISTDTRTLKPGALFIALRGESHDAHAFLGQAAAAGAAGAVVEQIPEGAPPELRYVVVPDTLQALGMLARFHRRRAGARVCAITGSNGKTTTKEMLRAVFSTKHRVHATPGNLNNLVGLPLTLLGTPAGTEVIIAELGTNSPGEIATLAGIAQPDAAVVTTISEEHLEGLHDLDGVIREETAVLPWLPPGAPTVVTDEPAVLARRASTLADNLYVAGFSERADAIFRGSGLALDAEGRVRFRWAGHDVALRLRGRHNGRNAILALAAGRLWDVDDKAAIAALGRIDATKMRAEFHGIGSLTVIADCYNSNPGSVEAAVDLLVSVPRRGGRVVVLGTMLELGEHSVRLHAATAHAIASADVDLIVATGEFVAAFHDAARTAPDRIILEEDPDAAFDVLAGRLHGNETILLKASRGVRLERLLPRFEQKWGVLHPHGEAFGSRASGTFTGDRSDAAPAEHSPTIDEGDDDADDTGPRARSRLIAGG